MSDLQTWPVLPEYLRVRHQDCGERVDLRRDEKRGIHAYCDKCKRYVRTGWKKHWVKKADGSYGYEETASLAPEVNLSVED